MGKYKTVEEITAAFIKKGWSKDITFSEYDTQRNEHGFLFVKPEQKLFVMNGSGNIYDDNGNIYYFNIRCIEPQVIPIYIGR